MGNRPKWRTPVFKSTAAPNAHILVKVRTPFGQFVEGDGRTQCKAIARRTGVQCRQNAIQGAEVCKIHGGLRYLDQRIKALGGPRVSKKCVALGMKPRRYECASAIALEHLNTHVALSERAEFSKLSLSARGRKLLEIARDRGV